MSRTEGRNLVIKSVWGWGLSVYIALPMFSGTQTLADWLCRFRNATLLILQSRIVDSAKTSFAGGGRRFALGRQEDTGFCILSGPRWFIPQLSKALRPLAIYPLVYLQRGEFTGQTAVPQPSNPTVSAGRKETVTIGMGSHLEPSVTLDGANFNLI